MIANRTISTTDDFDAGANVCVVAEPSDPVSGEACELFFLSDICLRWVSMRLMEGSWLPASGAFVPLSYFN